MRERGRVCGKDCRMKSNQTKQSSSEMPAAMDKVTKFTSLFILPLGILLFIQGYFFRDMSFSDTVVTTSAGLLGMLPKGLVFADEHRLCRRDNKTVKRKCACS